MSQFEKAWEKFNRVPIPNDITLHELKYIIEHFGMVLENRGKHGWGVRCKEIGIIIPIPYHSGPTKPVYIKQVKEAIIELEQMKKTDE